MTDIRKPILGEYCRCGHCKHEGYAYGVVTELGGSELYCQGCGRSNKLTKIPSPKNKPASVVYTPRKPKQLIR